MNLQMNIKKQICEEVTKKWQRQHWFNLNSNKCLDDQLHGQKRCILKLLEMHKYCSTTNIHYNLIGEQIFDEL